MNLPNWTGGCTRHEVRVAIEVKNLMRAPQCIVMHIKGAPGGTWGHMGAPDESHGFMSFPGAVQYYNKDLYPLFHYPYLANLFWVYICAE